MRGKERSNINHREIESVPTEIQSQEAGERDREIRRVDQVAAMRERWTRSEYIIRNIQLYCDDVTWCSNNIVS